MKLEIVQYLRIDTADSAPSEGETIVFYNKYEEVERAVASLLGSVDKPRALGTFSAIADRHDVAGRDGARQVAVGRGREMRYPLVYGEFRKGGVLGAYEGLLARCRPTRDGFAATAEAAPWRLGAVLLARRSDGIAVVRKAADPGGAYEFAGRLALPGGMVRTAGIDDGEVGRDVKEALRTSLRDRVAREAGIVVPARLQSLDIGPIATSYYAKARQRFTLVLGYEGQAEDADELGSCDASIDEAFWMPRPIRWAAFAPANCVLLGHVLWSRLAAEERDAARSPIRAAHALCCAWAAELEVPSLPEPWAEDERLREWRASWSRIR